MHAADVFIFTAKKVVDRYLFSGLADSNICTFSR